MQSLGVQSEVVAPIIYPERARIPPVLNIWGLLMVQVLQCSPPVAGRRKQTFCSRSATSWPSPSTSQTCTTDSRLELVKRRKTEAALRQSKERLTTAQAIAHMGNWELDVENGSHDLVRKPV
jgi:hypothetical protein